jgi:antirestriction protein ArdC
MSSGTEKRREEFAERVSRSLDAGIVPWQHKNLPPMPVQSAVSGRSYSGLNALMLMERCAEKGYTDPRFITSGEANKNGLFIRKGEHGVALEHWTKGDDGKVKVQGYSVFNIQQLNGRLPAPESATKPDLEKANRMLKNAGIDLPPDSGVKEYRDAIKALTVKAAEEAGVARDVHTPELLALRCNIASTILMREAGLPVEQAEGVATQSWAKSIKHDPSQLYKAARDGGNIAGVVMKEMTQNRDAQFFQASQERMEAQRGQELVSEAATVPRGLDSNLPNADLSGVQEGVIASAAKASAQVNDLRASATIHEQSAHESGAGMDKLAEARTAAKKHLGDGAIVTTAQPGKSYQGKILSIIGSGPDRAAIQAISDNHAVLHDIRDIAAKSSLEVGKDVTLATDAEGYSAVQDRGAEKKSKKAERAREGKKR